MLLLVEVELKMIYPFNLNCYYVSSISSMYYYFVGK